MKAELLVRDALQEIGQQAAEQPVKADEMATGIRYANRIANSYTKLGLGWTNITSSSQEVTVPVWAEWWLVLMLAKALMPQFPSVDDSTKFTLEANLKAAWKNLLDNQQELPVTTYPSTLPVGSGNEWTWSDRFYPVDDNNILQENGDNILLED